MRAVLFTVKYLVKYIGLMTNKAVFFDRDDTLIKDVGYMFDPEDLKYFPRTIETLKVLAENNFELFIVTNQSGVGRGYFTLDQMHKFNDHLQEDLKKQGIEIKDIAFCPHSPEDNCGCRKPLPKMILDLCSKHNIDRDQSFMFGDKDSDLKAGENAGLKSFKIHGRDISEVLKHVASSKF